MDQSAVRTQLDQLAASPHFIGAQRLCELLRYVVEARLAQECERLTQKRIARDVFGRDERFDSAIDSVVRVEMARLRSKLRDYYDSAGAADPIRFRLPKGSYVPEIEECGSPAPETRAGAPGPPALAVMPFLNMSEDASQEYFADGITEDLITELARVPGLLVFARHSTFRYKGSDAGAARIGGELGASHILEGSARRAGSRIRITAQLIDIASQCHLWAERYDLEDKDIFAVQDDVTRRIVAALSIELGSLGPSRSRVPDARVQAHDLVLQGSRYQTLYSREGNAHACRLYAQALEIDPEFAVAHARLAIALTYQGLLGWSASPIETFARAVTTAEKAVELDPRLPLAHAALAWSYNWHGRAGDAVATARRAMELGPSDGNAHMFACLVLGASGYGEEAVHAIERAAAIDPADPFYFPRGFAFMNSGRYQEALELLKCSIARFPDFMPARINLAACCGYLGLMDEGKAQVRIIEQKSPRHLIGIRHTKGVVMGGLRKLQGLD